MGEQPKVVAANWREHAQQARKQATAASDLDTKRLHYAAAEYYDNRARQAEQPPASTSAGRIDLDHPVPDALRQRAMSSVPCRVLRRLSG